MFREKQSLEVDNASVISGHFPLVHEFAHSCVQQASIQISLILWSFSNLLIITTCIVALEQTKIHLIVKPTKTKTRTNPQATVLLCFSSHFLQGDLYSSDDPISNVRLYCNHTVSSHEASTHKLLNQTSAE